VLAVVGAVLLVGQLAPTGPRRVAPEFIVARHGYTVGDLIQVRAPIGGTVLSVRAADRQPVKAGSALIALSPTRYETALAHAEGQAAAARAHVRRALAALAVQERAASAAVRAAMRDGESTPRAAARPQMSPTDARADVEIAQARRQVVAAQARVQQIAATQLAAARAVVDRDTALQADGLIASRDVTADTQAYDAARRQAAAATASLREAQAALVAPSPEGQPRASAQPGGAVSAAALARATAAVAAAQATLDRAQAARATAQQAVDRDTALLADGAIPAHQLDVDRTASDAASAQVDAADSAVRAARAQLAVLHTSRPLAAAPATGSSAPPAGATELARQAEAALAEAQRRAAIVAAAQVDALSADGAVETAKADLSETVIRAPVSGWVASSAVVAGQRVHPGQALVSLSIPGRTWVAAEIPQAEAERVRVGDPVRVTVDGARGQVWNGRVLRVGTAPPALPRAARGAVAVRIALDRSDGEDPLTGGLRADVAIDTRRAAPTATVTRRGAARPAPSAVATGAERQVREQTVAARNPRDERLAQIADRERRIVAQLNAESAQIQRIVTAAAPGPHGGAVPTFLNDGLLWPVPGAVSSGYGWRIHPIFHTLEFHTGIDIAASWGAPVKAAGDGTVIFAGSMTASGRLVILDHGDGLSTMYSHLSTFLVRVGDRVRRGQTIARVGSTGWSTGPHLFFELRKDGQPRDPIDP